MALSWHRASSWGHYHGSSRGNLLWKDWGPLGTRRTHHGAAWSASVTKATAPGSGGEPSFQVVAVLLQCSPPVARFAISPFGPAWNCQARGQGLFHQAYTCAPDFFELAFSNFPNILVLALWLRVGENLVREYQELNKNVHGITVFNSKKPTGNMCTQTQNKKQTSKQKSTGNHSNVCFSLSLIFNFAISCLDF